MSELPQLDAPFAISRTGPVTVPQGTTAEHAANVYNITVCRQGYREDDPTFGLAQLAFKAVPIDLQSITSAIEEQEPDADLEAEEVVEALQAGLNHGGVDITIEVT